MDQEELLTVPEAAARARLAARTIRRAIAQGQLRVVRPGGLRRVLIPVAALGAFVYGTTELPDEARLPSSEPLRRPGNSRSAAKRA
jgi:excisionase family DNA binding protein